MLQPQLPSPPVGEGAACHEFAEGVRGKNVLRLPLANVESEI